MTQIPTLAIRVILRDLEGSAALPVRDQDDGAAWYVALAAVAIG